MHYCKYYHGQGDGHKESLYQMYAQHNQKSFGLNSSLQASGCTVIHAEEDADRLIVETAVKSLFNHPTIVIADDTDVLILLIHYAPTSS